MKNGQTYFENLKLVNPFIATIALIQKPVNQCTANQLIGFYMRATLAINELKIFRNFLSLYLKGLKES